MKFTVTVEIDKDRHQLVVVTSAAMKEWLLRHNAVINTVKVTNPTWVYSLV